MAEGTELEEGRVSSIVLREGGGWRCPRVGDEVLVTLRAATHDGHVIEERSAFEYQLGSGALGAAGALCDEALQTMKQGGLVQLTCAPGSFYGEEAPEGAVLSLALDEIFDIKDISFAKDQSIMKKLIVKGDGYCTAREGAGVRLRVLAVVLDTNAASDGCGCGSGGATSSTAPPPAEALEFVAGDGEVCDALEAAALAMKLHERCELRVSHSRDVSDNRLGLQDVAGPVRLTLEMEGFDEAKEPFDMSPEEKLAFCEARKEVGTVLFRGGRLRLALQRYKRVADVVCCYEEFEEVLKVEARKLKLVAELNKAACLLKLGEPEAARVACEAALKEDRNSAKALYRRAQAALALGEAESAVADCRRLLELEPGGREARALLQQARTVQRCTDAQRKDLFVGMCRGLGREAGDGEAADASSEALAGGGSHVTIQCDWGHGDGQVSSTSGQA